MSIRQLSSTNPGKFPVRFQVDRVLYRDEETYFTLCLVTFDRKEYGSNFVPTSEQKITGLFASTPFQGDEYTATGEWIDDKRGWVFRVDPPTRVLPSGDKMVMKFLSSFVKGIGRGTARDIVEHYGASALEKIGEGPEKLLEVKGIGKKKAERIYEEFMKQQGFEKVAMFTLGMGAGPKATLRIYKEYGVDAIRIIRSNPYIMCQIDGIGFKMADQFAAELGFKGTNPIRIREAIRYYIEQEMNRNGHMFVKMDDLKKDIPAFLQSTEVFKFTPVAEETILTAVEELQNRKDIIVEKDEDGEYVYLKFFNFIENKIVQQVIASNNREFPRMGSVDKLAAFLRNQEEKGHGLATAQKQAIAAVADSGFSILTGGPGTGKTHTVNKIIEYFKLVMPHAVIELAAPTGKAAMRMTELTGMEASTLHRLIGIHGEDDLKDDSENLAADLLVIDEASMIDSFVFHRVLKALKDETRVLIVGDHEQLPSVGPGLVLRDLIESGKVRTTRLTEIFRQAKESQIVQNAHAILTGDASKLAFDHAKKDFYFMETWNAKDVQKKLIDSVERLLISNRFKLEDIQILTPMRKGMLGVDDLNRGMQERFNPLNLERDQIRMEGNKFIRKGDRVIQTVNDYGLGVMNGEVGYVQEVVEIEGEKRLVIEFEDGKEVEYDLLLADGLELAYAITIHKSQGSEFPCVLMPVHSTQSFMLSKNLLYTAITRAKEMVALVGEFAALETAAQREDGTKRNSRIEKKLKK